MKASEKLSASEVRRINRNRVYMYLYSQELPKTKRDIEQNLHVSMPTVTQNLKELLEKELIAYVGTEESTGGRKARQIAINPLARFAVGIELSPKHIRYVAVDLCAREIAFSEIAEQFRDDESFLRCLQGSWKNSWMPLRSTVPNFLGSALPSPALWIGRRVL